ncbi:hypothetical protein G7068_08310 [Leucobacter viscericola]|uniref:Uncharacterized protein n=1 Tax=Leucobacter viscericola TaxID=2714935 RepID=A0A6G7XFP3_9MICO|nr:hypothetical protein [Leucobacter viscericola]QIK63198.1 hypothetical protein G7068_08310 [Leucobacter viscericola]
MTNTYSNTHPSDSDYTARESGDTVRTREQSRAKPRDHQRGPHDVIRVDFAGEHFEVDSRAPKHTPTMFALRNNDIETVLSNLIGEDSLARVIKALEDEDGFSDFEKLTELVNVIYEKVGAKNS